MQIQVSQDLILTDWVHFSECSSLYYRYDNKFSFDSMRRKNADRVYLHVTTIKISVGFGGSLLYLGEIFESSPYFEKIESLNYDQLSQAQELVDQFLLKMIKLKAFL